MNCREVREQVIGRSQLSPAIQQHIDGCENCRAFYADVQDIQAACDEPAETPTFLREHTLARCAELLRAKTAAGKATVWRRWGRVLDSPRFVASGAIAGIVILITVTAVQIGNAQDDAVSVPLKLSIFQVLAQNVFTALFLPALLLFRGRLAGTATRAMRTGE